MRQETSPSTPEGTPKAHLPQQTGQQQQNPLRRKRMNDELKRKLTILEEQLNEQKKTKMYQKQLRRLKQKSEDTPRSKTKSILKNWNTKCDSRQTVRKTLELHFCLVNQIKDNYKNRKKICKRSGCWKHLTKIPLAYGHMADECTGECIAKTSIFCLSLSWQSCLVS